LGIKGNKIYLSNNYQWLIRKLPGHCNPVINFNNELVLPVPCSGAGNFFIFKKLFINKKNKLAELPIITGDLGKKHYIHSAGFMLI